MDNRPVTGQAMPNMPSDPNSGSEVAMQSALLLNQLNMQDRVEHRVRRGSGIVYLLGAAATATAIASGAASHIHIGKTMPYMESAQRVVNNLDNVLEDVGIGVGIAALATVGAVKMGARRDSRLQIIDDWSSREMSSDKNGHKTVFRKGLEATVAGKVPAMAALGAGLAVFSTAISTEVSDGPQRPIETALSALAPGNQMVVNYSGAMPMVESSISRPLVNKIIATAQAQGVKASILDENLGQLTHGHQSLYDLSLGVEVPTNSPISWRPVDTGKQIPVAVDSSAHLKIGTNIELNGVPAKVVEEINGISATNRVGVVMDERAMAVALKKSDEAPVHSVVIDGTPEQAQAIYAAANSAHETSTLITKEKYLQNSKDFWEANVKPITSVLAAVSGIFAGAVMGFSSRERLVRNRREWAAKSGMGVSQAMIRSTEMLRAVKNGIAASVVGVVGAFSTPLIVNSLESGFKAEVGFKEIAVGVAIGVGGSVVGAAKSVLRPEKIINTKENTR